MIAQLSRGGFDDNGDPIVASEPVSFDAVVWPVRVANTSSEDRPEVDYDITSTRYIMSVADASVDIRQRDTVTWNGMQFQVMGQDFPWESPFTGWAPGRIFELERQS